MRTTKEVISTSKLDEAKTVANDKMDHQDSFQAILNWLNELEFKGTEDQWNLIIQAIDTIETLLQLKSGGIVFSSQMAQTNRHFIDYLRQLVPASGDMLSGSDSRFSALKKALSNDFYTKLHSCEIKESKDPHSKEEELSNELLYKQERLTISQHADISNITQAYLGKESPQTTLTEVGRQYQKVMDHFTQIGAARSLTPILELVVESKPQEEILFSESPEENPSEKAQQLKLVVDHLHNAFFAIQDGYYAGLAKYYFEYLTILHAKANPEAGKDTDSLFQQYCEAILFNGNQERITGLLSELTEKQYSQQSLNQAQYELSYHLKPLLYAKRKAIANEIKQLKININHLMQAMGQHSRFNKPKEENDTDKSLIDFLQHRYEERKSLNTSHWLIAADKQDKRLTNQYCSYLGITTAMTVGACEGTVGGAALWAALKSGPLAPFAAAFGSIAFLSGSILNYLLLKLDSINLFKELGFGTFNLDNDGEKLSPFNQFLNITAYLLALGGTGLVFASVFLTEFLKVAFDLLSSLQPGLQAPAKIIAILIGLAGAAAELFGISALIHMENNKIIKNGMQAIFSDISFYCDKKFYVALPQQWNSAAGFGANMLELVKQAPRLLVSLLTTAISVGIMGYYIKMTFTLFSSMVAGLAATYLGGLLATTGLTANMVGILAAGINAFITFMTFTLPLGKLVVQITELAVELAVLSGSLVTATALAVVGIPYAIYNQGELTIGQAINQYFANFLSTGLSAYFWLTSNSELDSIVENSLAKKLQEERTGLLASEPEDKAVEDKAIEATLSDWQRFKANLTTFIEKCVIYPFCLIANSLGQAFLFLPLGLKSLTNPVHLVEAIIQGIRSFAMNLKAILNNMALRQGGNPASADTPSLFSSAPTNAMLFPTRFDQGGEIEENEAKVSFIPPAAAAC